MSSRLPVVNRLWTTGSNGVRFAPPALDDFVRMRRALRLPRCRNGDRVDEMLMEDRGLEPLTY